TLNSLVREADQRVRKLPDGDCSASDRQFLAQLLSITRSASDHLDDPAHYRNPWHGMVGSPAGPVNAPGGARHDDEVDLLQEPQYFFSGDGALAFLLVRPIQSERSFTGAKENVDALRGLVDGVRAE